MTRPTRRQKEDLAMALRLLSRSAAALVAQQLGPAAQRLPSDWNPFASLAGAAPCCHALFHAPTKLALMVPHRRPAACVHIHEPAAAYLMAELLRVSCL